MSSKSSTASFKTFPFRLSMSFIKNYFIKPEFSKITFNIFLLRFFGCGLKLIIIFPIKFKFDFKIEIIKSKVSFSRFFSFLLLLSLQNFQTIFSKFLIWFLKSFIFSHLMSCPDIGWLFWLFTNFKNSWL
jgi:hypothetical protein